MSRLLKSVLTVLLLCQSGRGQVVVNLVLTSGQGPVANAMVSYGSGSGSTDQKGFMRISGYPRGTKIGIRKLGYRDTSFSIDPVKDTVDITVLLRPRFVEIGEVTVTAGPIREVNPWKAAFILDYEVSDGYVFQLLSDEIVLVIDAENNVRKVKAPPGTESLMRDPHGWVNIVSSTAVSKLDPRTLAIRADTGRTGLNGFSWMMTYCDAVDGEVSYVRRYKDLNQTVAFFALKPPGGRNAVLLKEITDRQRAQAVRDFASMANGMVLAIQAGDELNLAGDLGENINTRQRRDAKNAAWHQQNIERPSYNVLRIINDTVRIFAHDIDTVYTYSRSGRLIRKCHVSYHHLRTWDGELIADEQNRKVYGRFLSGGTTMLAEIDVVTGRLKLPFIPLPGARMRHKIRVSGNTAYYQGKHRKGAGYTLYSQKL